ncbi:MAG TPA: signal peptidase I [Lentisphaerae bacterium]|nr:MAG: signal peptidase I [Verrucomicrobiota bacterium]HDL77181.1 signal peptidase I [Lentisphaerota bacterium]
MIRVFRRYRTRRRLMALWKECCHFVNVRGDICDPSVLQQLKAARDQLRDALRRKNDAGAMDAATRCAFLLGKASPPKSFPRLRENIEVLAVALAVAMGFRTYFLQPFKIPTGSMQPTLYGITVAPAERPGLSDRFPLNIIKLALFGERFISIRAQTSGIVSANDVRFDIRTRQIIFYIARIPHKIHRNMVRHFQLGQYVHRGQILATGRVHYGDHIFVNKVAYNIRRPRRGEIVVFNTDHIRYPGVMTNTFYIKRLVALPSERVSISPPYIMINGRPLQDPPVFTGLLLNSRAGYTGYQLPNRIPGAPPPLLSTPSDSLTLEPGEYLLLGDNSGHSLDGRYFGPVNRTLLVGPAVFVYWPLSRRWGPLVWGG